MSQEHKRLAVEDAAIQKKLGMEPGSTNVEGDDMGDIFMADNITLPSEPQRPDPFKTLLGTAALAGAVGLPLAWLGSKYIDSQRPDPPAFVDTDTDTTRGVEILK